MQTRKMKITYNYLIRSISDIDFSKDSFCFIFIHTRYA